MATGNGNGKNRFTARHYEAVADVVAGFSDDIKPIVAKAFADMFERDSLLNSRTEHIFKAHLFYERCKVRFKVELG